MRAIRFALWTVRAALTLPLMLVLWIASKCVRGALRLLGGAA